MTAFGINDEILNSLGDINALTEMSKEDLMILCNELYTKHEVLVFDPSDEV